MVKVATKVEGDLDALSFWTEATSRAVGEVIADQIRERTLSGIGADGVPFGRGADGRVIDLYESGRMLGSLGVKSADSDSAVIDTDVDYDAQPRYVFLGIAPGDEAPIARAVQDAVDREIARSARASGTPTAAGGT